jgi:hypothetical protein
MNVKTLLVESSPAARGENKSISVRVDQAVQGFLDANPKAEVRNIGISGDVKPNSYSQVLVVLLYDGPKAAGGQPETKMQRKARAAKEAKAQADKAKAAGGQPAQE